MRYMQVIYIFCDTIKCENGLKNAVVPQDFILVCEFIKLIFSSSVILD